MIKQMKKGYAVIVTSIVIAGLAIFLFYMNYFDNFYYPLVGYIFGLYIEKVEVFKNCLTLCCTGKEYYQKHC